MALSPGSRVGPYEVVALLGEGGMGKVWRAHHTGLKRDDALKVLPDAVAADAERLARFQREAQILASLNHPNIAHAYGLEQADGAQALVLELVEGPTLADRIAEGALPIVEALPIALQVAEALEAAHERGIIHRDLKPANIKVRTDGTVKVLDFGLAKALEPASLPADMSQAPTMTSPTMMTGVGVLLGTATYMSPEQAKGRPADKRSDVWAFGCVLYEMLTGARAFGGDDVSETLAAILLKEPDWSRLPVAVPPAVRALVRGALVKARKDRIGDIASALFALRHLQGLDTDGLRSPAATPARARWKPPVWLAAAAGLGAAATAAAFWATRQPAAPSAPMAVFSLGADHRLTTLRLSPIGISRDGSRLVYVEDGQLYLRPIGDAVARPIAGTPGSGGLSAPAFSPDGRSIAYLGGGTVLRTIATSGGTPTTVGDLPALGFFNGSDIYWDESGLIINGRDADRWRIGRVQPNGGTPEILVNGTGDEMLHAPQMLPGGRHLLFAATRTQEDPDSSTAVVQSLETGERRTVLDRAGSGARYIPSGHLIFANGGTVFAVPFDLAELRTTGAQVPVLAGVRRGFGVVGQTRPLNLAVSDTGTVLYVPGPPGALGTGGRAIVVTQGGTSTALPIPRGPYMYPRVSRDGRQLAYERQDGAGADIEVYALGSRTTPRRFTFSGSGRFPVWSGDGRFIAFQSGHEGDKAIFRQRADGSGGAERLTRPETGFEHVPETWSPDNAHLIYRVVKDNRHTLWDLTIGGTAVPFGGVESLQPIGAVFSPDGRWVAYAVADTPGGAASRNRGVFIQPYPATGARYQAPRTVLDYHPVWSADGTTLSYIPSAARIPVSMTVQIRPVVAFGPPVEATGTPRPGLMSAGYVRGYDAIGAGFVVATEADMADAQSGYELRVILNWFDELKRIAPAGARGQ